MINKYNDFTTNQQIEEFLEIEKESNNIISENDIKLWSRCPYAYFHKNFVGLTKIPQHANSVEAQIFARARKGLFKIRDPDTGRLFDVNKRVGKQFKTLAELTTEELPKYLAFSSPLKFGNSIARYWESVCDQGIFDGNNIFLINEKQKQRISKELRIACIRYYKFVLEKRPPIPEYINKDTSVDVEGIKIRIRFPEIRYGMIIDDPTIWSFNAEHYYDNKSNINNSTLVTLRILGFNQLASTYPAYSRVWKIPDEYIEKMKKETIIPEVKYRNINCLSNELKETHRSAKDIDLLKKVIDHFLKDVATKNYRPNHSSCKSCPYNILNDLGKPICDESTYSRNLKKFV